MRVFHIAPDYPNSKLYCQLISSLENVNYQNEVYVQSEESNNEQNFPVHYLGRDFGLIDRILFFRKQSIIFKDILNRHLVDNVDIVHAHNLFSAGYNALRLKQARGIPYVVAVRNTDVNAFFHYMIHLRRTGVKVMREADAVIFLSPAYRDYVVKKYISKKDQHDVLNKCYVIPNGLDPYFMDCRAVNPKRVLDKTKIRLIYAGDVDKNKNVGTTLKACNFLIERGYKVNLIVVGRIKDKAQEDIKNLEFVNYYPFSPKEKVCEYYRQSDIFVMPSIHETFGLVYIEAMSQGLPVIYTKGQGFDGYFEEGHVGYHVPCFDEQAIAGGIIKILEDYSPMSDRCIKAVEDFSWKKIASEYQEIYKRILHN